MVMGLEAEPWPRFHKKKSSPLKHFTFLSLFVIPAQTGIHN